MSTQPSDLRGPRRPVDRRRNGASDSALDMRELLRTLQSVRDGDFSVRMPSDMTGLAGKIADTVNEIVMSNEQMSRELARAGENVGKQGQIRHRVSMHRHEGSDVGAALGAARLARLAVTGEAVNAVCVAAPTLESCEPERAQAPLLAQRLARYRSIYQALKAGFAESAA